MELTSEHIQIIQGKMCPYCKIPTEHVSDTEVYKNGGYGGMIYLCRKCLAYCGCHKSRPTESLGRLANKELREAKIEAHKYFDMIWQEKHISRGELYGYLSEWLNLPPEYTHMGMFGLKTLKEVVYFSKQKLNDLRRLDMDFGIDVKRPHYDLD